MRLSRLNIAGFKSFPDRAELGFDQGVTAIVGPNGCGKSNVVDAFKWVLGEQSARALRGRQMADMIFNGSSTRKSSGVAQVVYTSGFTPGLLVVIAVKPYSFDATNDPLQQERVVGIFQQ